jgi:hypothetical protein
VSFHGGGINQSAGLTFAGLSWDNSTDGQAAGAPSTTQVQIDNDTSVTVVLEPFSMQTVFLFRQGVNFVEFWVASLAEVQQPCPLIVREAELQYPLAQDEEWGFHVIDGAMIFHGSTGWVWLANLTSSWTHFAASYNKTCQVRLLTKQQYVRLLQGRGNHPLDY